MMLREGVRVRELTERPMTLAELSKGPKYVYVLKGGPLIKIGISSNVENRVKYLLNASFPYPIEICRRWRTPFAREIEGLAHCLLVQHRSHSEWFRVPPRVATALIALLIEARPATRRPKSFKYCGILFCCRCQNCDPILSTPSRTKSYHCRSCGGEMETFALCNPEERDTNGPKVNKDQKTSPGRGPRTKRPLVESGRRPLRGGREQAATPGGYEGNA